MNKKEAKQLASVERGSAALRDIPRDPRCQELRRLREQLDERVARAKEGGLRQMQVFRSRGGTGAQLELKKDDLREELLLPLSRKARLLFKHDPELVAALRVPPKRARPAIHAEAALTMAKRLRPYIAFCHAEGFPRGFYAQLRSEGKALRDMARNRNTTRAGSAPATREFRRALREARELLPVIEGELRRLYRRSGNALSPFRASMQIALKVWRDHVKLMGRPGRPRKRGGGGNLDR